MSQEKKSWIKKHPVWTGIILLILIVFVVSLFSSGSQGDRKQDSKTEENVTQAQNIIENNPPNQKEYCNKDNGVELCILGYGYYTIGEDYGELKTLHIKVDTSNANSGMFLDIYAEISDKEDRKFINDKDLGTIELLLEDEIYEKNLTFNLPVGHISKEKVFKVYAKEPFGQPYVVTQFETNLSEGFN